VQPPHQRTGLWAMPNVNEPAWYEGTEEPLPSFPHEGFFPQDAKPAESRTQPVPSPYLRHFSFTFTRLLTHKGTATLQASKA